MTSGIENYALIGDLHTAALVGRDGSIDWLCLDRFDSPACFAALLGDENNGRWRIAPKDEPVEIVRRYRPNTLILETDFSVADGKIRVIDFMPVGMGNPNVVRIVQGLAGHVSVRADLTIRFDYGRLVPWVTRRRNGSLSAVVGPHSLLLSTSAGLRGEDKSTVSEFTVSEGDTVVFTLSYGLSYEKPPSTIDPWTCLEQTSDYWSQWSDKCTYGGRYRDAVVRSLITLKALIYAPTGGTVAAPTTSLPEAVGGSRNWDYRFCWLRDATFTLLSLMSAGYEQEARAWRRWLVRAVAGSGNQVQPLYTILGVSEIGERELPWLSGFGGAKPVRVGNAAYRHLQLDIFGEVIDTLHQARRNNLEPSESSWDIQLELMQYLEKVKGEPDRGIWESRGEPQHFTHSKVMIWVAFDRAVASAEQFGLKGPVNRWRKLRDQMHEEICARAFDKDIGAFVQAYGSKKLDAACLLIPLVGFLPATDPRMLGTTQAIRKSLMIDGLVRRYDTGDEHDGLPKGEGEFLPCSFWFADNLILQGRRGEAENMFRRLLSLRNDVGLLSEEYDASHGMLGNFPQALSHLALIGTARNLYEHPGPSHERGSQSS